MAPKQPGRRDHARNAQPDPNSRRKRSGWRLFARKPKPAAESGAGDAPDCRNRDNEYAENILLAHQRAVPLINTPALACNLGFRVSEAHDPVEQTAPCDFDKTMRARVDGVNKFLAHLYDLEARPADKRRYFLPVPPTASRSKLSEGQTSPPAAAFEIPAGAERVDPYDTLSVEIRRLHCFRITLSVIMQTEFTTLTFVAWPMQTLEQLSAECSELCRGTLEALTFIMADNAQLSADVPNPSALYEDFWKECFVELKIDESLRKAPPADGALNELGELFARFESLILRTRNGFERVHGKDARPAIEAQIELSQRQESYSFGATAKMIRVENDIEDSSIAEDVSNFVNDRSNLFARILGFSRSTTEPEHDPGQAILCRMFHGLAIYGSNLRPPESVSAEPQSHVRALRLFFVYGGPSRHQLGRLIRIINRCGELRLAALFDYDAVRQASNDIRHLDLQITAAHEQQRESEQRRANARRAAPRPAPINLHAWRRRVSDIARFGRGGLAYRVSRSNYYFRALEERIDSLRTDYLSGWQTYGDFIRQNLYRHFNNIADIGARFETLQTRLRRIEGAKTVEQLNDQQHSLLRLQRASDLFALFAVIYYVGQINYYALAFFEPEQWLLAWNVPILFELSAEEMTTGRHLVGYGFGAVFAWLARALYDIFVVRGERRSA